MLRFISRTLLRKLFYKPLSIDELRKSQNRSAKMMQKVPKAISVEGFSINELSAEWVTHKDHSLLARRRLCFWEIGDVPSTLWQYF
jgi:hypothetical protein